MCALALHDPTAEEPVADDDYTLAEVVRLVRQIREDVSAQFVGFRTELEEYVLTKVHDAQMIALRQELAALHREHNADRKADHERIARLEDGNTWLVRIVIAFVVLAILGAAFGTAALGR